MSGFEYWGHKRTGVTMTGAIRGQGSYEGGSRTITYKAIRFMIYRGCKALENGIGSFVVIVIVSKNKHEAITVALTTVITLTALV
jgi:hypothetical protein